jgi:hypothetical protein
MLIVIINLPSQILEIPSKSTIDKNDNLNTKVITILLQVYPQWLQILSKIWFSPNAVTSAPHQ